MKKSFIWLLALAAVAGWACVETFRLAQATDQVAESQQQQLRTSTKVEASRAKNVQVVQTDAGPGTSAPTDKR